MGIKVVVFDIGDVVLVEHASKSRKKLAKKFGFDENAFKIFAKKNLKKSYIGKLDAKDFFENLAKEQRVDVDVKDVVSFWVDSRGKYVRFNRRVLKLIKRLKKNYFLACLSDTTALNDIVREEIGVYDLFDLNVVSVKEGVRKPEKNIYNILLKKLRGYSPDEIVFIDDEAQNLIPAKRLGVNVIRFESFGKMKKDLKKLGVNV